MGFQLTITEGKGQGKEFHFDREVVRIGRLPDNDLVLYDTGVSRYHCEIVSHEGTYSLRDSGSANGTTLNEVITTEGRINDGDRIGVGPIIFVFVRTDELTQSKRRLAAAGQAVLRPEDEQARHLLEHDKTIALTKDEVKTKRLPDRKGEGESAREDKRVDAVPAVEPLESQDSAVGAVSVARTATGSFLAYRRTTRISLASLPRSTRVALGVAGALVVVAAAISVYFFTNQPRADRSAEIFPINGETALLKFGDGKVDVFTPDRVNFKFNYGGGRVTLSYAAGGVDSERELAILVNNAQVAFVEKSPKWQKGLTTDIPRSALKSGQNVVSFDNTFTPGRDETWAITQLQLLQQVLPPPDPKRAQELFTLGKASFDTRSVAPQNLYKSIQYYRDAALLLEGLETPPPLFEEIRSAQQASDEELASIHNAHMFSAQKAMRFGDYGEAAETLRTLLTYYPDPEDRRHKEVKETLTQVLEQSH